MTAADYLTARGWTPCTGEPSRDKGARWIDPVTGDSIYQSRALVIQRARDAAEERAAWVAFAAARSAIGEPIGDGRVMGAYAENGAAEAADALLREYRARFAVEIN